MADRTNVLDALKLLAARELEQWAGLQPGTTIDHVRALFDVDEEWKGAGRLGSMGRKTGWYSVPGEGFPEGLRLWFSAEELILGDARHPELPGGLEKLLTALGPPQDRLESYLGTLAVENSEWVYPERGLTVFVNPANRRLLRIAVYQPVGLSEYLEKLRLNLKRVRLPPGRNTPEGIFP